MRDARVEERQAAAAVGVTTEDDGGTRNEVTPGPVPA